MNESAFAGWLELFFNSSLAVPWSVCTGRDRQGKGPSPWQRLASPLRCCAALPMETELKILVRVSVSRSDSSGAPPPKPVQQVDNLWQSSCLSWEPWGWEGPEDLAAGCLQRPGRRNLLVFLSASAPAPLHSPSLVLLHLSPSQLSRERGYSCGSIDTKADLGLPHDPP